MSSVDPLEIVFSFTKEEAFVCYYKLAGKSHKEIAVMMGRSERDIQDYSSEIFRKTGVPGKDMEGLKSKIGALIFVVADKVDWKNWEWPTKQLSKMVLEGTLTKSPKPDTSPVTSQPVRTSETNQSVRPPLSETLGNFLETLIRNIEEAALVRRNQLIAATVIGILFIVFIASLFRGHGQQPPKATVGNSALIATNTLQIPSLLPTPIPTSTLAPPPTPTTAPTPTPTITLTSTFTPSPTSTPSPTFTPTPTITPTPTTTPTPTNTLTPTPTPLFADDFENGLSPSWKVLSGEPLIVDGMLSANDPVWLEVGDPSWKNIKIEYQVKLSPYADCHYGPFPGTFYPYSMLIGLRFQDKDNMIALKTGQCGFLWFQVANGNWEQMPTSGNGPGASVLANITILIEGNKITALINGDRSTYFVSTLYPKGSIGLRLGRDSYIDNFKVNALP